MIEFLLMFELLKPGTSRFVEIIFVKSSLEGNIVSQSSRAACVIVLLLL